jgi:hypothetical protein
MKILIKNLNVKLSQQKRQSHSETTVEANNMDFTKYTLCDWLWLPMKFSMDEISGSNIIEFVPSPGFNAYKCINDLIKFDRTAENPNYLSTESLRMASVTNKT